MNPGKPSPPPRISEAEWAVMRVLWEAEGATAAREVAQELGTTRDWSERTVKTLLARLVKKGVLGFETQGNRYLYHPLVSREECVQQESRSFLDRVFGGELSPLLASFVRSGELSREELDALRELLDQEEAR